MYKKVDSWVDLVALEREVLELWREGRTFERLREKNRGGKPWSFLDGPITANNPMGLHHAWGRTLKDCYQRFQAMHGREERYQNGFDCQGLWVEVEVEKELGFETKREIEDFGIDRFVERCKERVRKYAAIQTEQSIRLGYWMDWSDSYYTMSDQNNYMIWRFLRKCHDRGLIYRGHDVMPWCPRCGTGISQHEMHEGYREIESPSLVVRFPLHGTPGDGAASRSGSSSVPHTGSTAVSSSSGRRTAGPTATEGLPKSLLIWTTTPWTLTSNVAAAVSPDLEYVMVRQGEEVLYLASARAEAVLKRGGAYEVLARMPGRELVGWTYDGPFDELPPQKKAAFTHRVVPWSLVSGEEGTGIVHIAPGCGREDYELGREHGLPAIAPIDEEGVFLEGYGALTGKHAREVDGEITENLKAKGVLYAAEPYRHSYPHCWRCSTELLFRLVDEWFISMDAWRDEIKNVVREARWIPPFGLDLELDWLTNMRDWMISKKRYWGLALPIWVCGKCDSFQVIGSREELKEKAVAGWEKFEGSSPHRPRIDAVEIACEKCGSPARRIRDVGNPWLDAGIVAYSTVRYAEDREYWKKWIPADLVLECFPGQFRNWFYSLLAMSTMMEGIPPFKTLVGHALVRDDKGEEMHKSLGNAIPFEEAAEKTGVETLRWIFCRQDATKNLNFGYGLATEVRGAFLNTLWNTYAFFVVYARIADWTSAAGGRTLAERPLFDRWILSRLNEFLERAKAGYEGFDTRSVTLEAEAFVEDVSNWYIRHNRRRFWGELENADTRDAFATLYECLEALVRALAPIIPFLTEAIYQNLVRSVVAGAEQSVHLTEFPRADSGIMDRELTAQMGTVARIVAAGLAARTTAKIKVRQPLASLTIGPRDETAKAAVERFADLLKDDLNVKRLTIAGPGAEAPIGWRVKLDFGKVGKRLGKRVKEVAAWLAAHEAEAAAELRAGAESLEVPLGAETLSLAREEVLLEQKAAADLAVAEDAKCGWVAFDTRIDDELRREGLMRDLLRRLQVLRKEKGLDIADRISLTYSPSSTPSAREALVSFEPLVREELLCTSFAEGEGNGESHEIKVGSESLRVWIERAARPAEAARG